MVNGTVGRRKRDLDNVPEALEEFLRDNGILPIKEQNQVPVGLRGDQTLKTTGGATPPVQTGHGVPAGSTAPGNLNLR